MLSFGQSVDLIGGDMTGPVWLLKFGRSLSESEEEAPFVFADLKADVRLFDCFALAPPPPSPSKLSHCQTEVTLTLPHLLALS